MSPRELSITQSGILGVNLLYPGTIWATLMLVMLRTRLRSLEALSTIFFNCQLLKQFIKSMLFSFGVALLHWGPKIIILPTCWVILHWPSQPVSSSLSFGGNQWLWVVYTSSCNSFETWITPSTTGCSVSHLLTTCQDPAKPYDLLDCWDLPSCYLEGGFIFWG